MAKAKEPKPSYPAWQNVRFILTNLWRWEKKLLLLSAVRIPPLILLPFLMVWMPKVVLDGIARHMDAGAFMLNVSLVTAGIAACSVSSRWLEGRLTLAAQANRMQYVGMCFHKALDSDYDIAESPEGRKKLQKAEEANYNNACATEAIVNALVLLTANAFGILSFGGALAALSPWVTAAVLATALAGFLAMWFAQQYEHRNKDNWALTDRKIWHMMGACADSAAGKDIRLYGLSGWFRPLFRSLLGERMVWRGRVFRRNFLADAAGGVMALLRDGAAYAFLIGLALARRISVADFVLYFGLVAGFSAWITGLMEQLAHIRRMSLQICDTRDYLEMPDRFRRGPGAPVPAVENGPPSLELRHISFTYPGSEAPTLTDINLSVAPGEKIALVGVNGAGKSTAVKVLCGLYHPSSGGVCVNGADICEYNRDEYYGLFAVVFQESYVPPVSIARFVSPDEDTPPDMGRVARCLELAGLADKVGGLPGGAEAMLVKEVNDDAVQLSGGEMQKLLLARALYRDAPFIVLDEPTAALDPIAESELYERYGELAAGRTSLFISHRLASTRFCDRIAFLEGGRIAECGTHEELMALGGRYAAMFRVQSHYYQDNPESAWKGGEAGEALEA